VKVGGKQYTTSKPLHMYSTIARADGARGCAARMVPVTADPVSHATVAAEDTSAMVSARDPSCDHSAAIAFDAVMVNFTAPTSTRLSPSIHTDVAKPTWTHAAMELK
jgi:hypothetical protein